MAEFNNYSRRRKFNSAFCDNSIALWHPLKGGSCAYLPVCHISALFLPETSGHPLAHYL